MQTINALGLPFSRMTLGTVQLGMNYGIANQHGMPSREESFSLLQSALDEGINSFDTALHYGESETVLGEFFTRTGHPPLLTTKFKLSLPISDSEVEGQIRTSLQTSLARLKIDQIPVYMVHNPADLLGHGPAVAAELEKLKDEGKILHAAVSVYTSEEVVEMLKYPVYDAVQLPMNLFDLRIVSSGMLEKLNEKGKAVFVRSIFLQGLFFKNPDELTGNLCDAQKPLRMLKAFAQEANKSIAQLALSFIRDLNGVTSLVIGAETPQQVRENARLVDSPALPSGLRAEMEKAFTGLPAHLLNPSKWRL